MFTQPASGLRAELLAAAARLLRERGVRGLTTREIAREAGCSDGALYVHFATKAELLTAVCDQFLPDLFAALGDVVDRVGVGDITDTLEAMTRSVLAVYDELVPISLAIGGDAELVVHRREELGRRGLGPRRGVEAIGAYLAAERRLGRVAEDADVMAAAAALLASCWFRVMHRHWFGSELLDGDDDHFARRIAGTVTAGLLPPMARTTALPGTDAVEESAP